jgi:hypothetical protein
MTVLTSSRCTGDRLSATSRPQGLTRNGWPVPVNQCQPADGPRRPAGRRVWDKDDERTPSAANRIGQAHDVGRPPSRRWPERRGNAEVSGQQHGSAARRGLVGLLDVRAITGVGHLVLVTVETAHEVEPVAGVQHINGVRPDGPAKGASEQAKVTSERPHPGTLVENELDTKSGSRLGKPRNPVDRLASAELLDESRDIHLPSRP